MSTGQLHYSKDGRPAWRRRVALACTLLAVLAYLSSWLYMANTGYEIYFPERTGVIRQPSLRYQNSRVMQIVFGPAYWVDRHVRPGYWRREGVTTFHDARFVVQP